MADSLLFPGESVIGDHSPTKLFDTPAGMSKGYEGMYKNGYSASPLTMMPDSFLIDRSEWSDRANEKEKSESRLSDLIIYTKLPPKNQQQTNYCWCTAPTGAFEALRAFMNEPMIEFSNASIGGPITGYKNVGGYGEAALQWMVEHGTVPSTEWPNNAINKKYNTSANQQTAMQYRVGEWWKLDPNNIEQVASCVLQNIPVCVGYDWWGHEVYVVDLLFVNGQPAFRIRNSWGDIPTFPNGFGVLTGKKMIPNDAVAPRQATV